LELLSRTVFVLSCFDKEINIEDEDVYRKGLDINRRNIIGRLRDFGLLDNDEEVSIVAVSANPLGKDLEKYWLLHLEELKKLSHIGLLQEATTEKIKAAGNASALVEASKKSIASDILMHELPVAIERDEKINAECERLSDACSDVREELEKTKSNLNETKIALRDFIIDLFTNLIRQAKGLDMDTVVDFFEQNIGSEGIVLNTTIQSEFERQLGSAYHEVDRMEISLDSCIKQYNNVIRESIGTYVKEGIKGAGQFLKAGVNITTESVKAARNFIMPAFKFKPWGAVKLASGLNRAIPIFGQVLGIVIDVGESIHEAVKKEEFKKGIDNLVSIFARQRSEYAAFINDENEFTRKCFPNYVALQKKVEELMAELGEKKAQREKFRRWREQGEAIEAEFKIIL
jgi:hypothetical protein